MPNNQLALWSVVTPKSSGGGKITEKLKQEESVSANGSKEKKWGL